jgi:hypothetical protein
MLGDEPVHVRIAHELRRERNPLRPWRFRSPRATSPTLVVTYEAPIAALLDQRTALLADHHAFRTRLLASALHVATMKGTV